MNSAAAMMALPSIPASPRDVSSACFHCGTTVPRNSSWTVVIDGMAQAMCCPGCQAVAQAIADYGCTSYYRERTVVSATVDAMTLIPAELHLYDMPEATAGFTPRHSTEANAREGMFGVDGIRCAACSWLIERRLARVPGIKSASMNVATERLHVQWNADACKPSDILQAVREVGYAAYPFDAGRHGRQLEQAGKKLFRQLFIAGLCMMQVMMYAFPAYITSDGSMETDMAALMRWASLLLTLPAVLYSAQPFFAGAWSGLRHRTLGMDMPVALGIGAAFIASVGATWRGEGDVYFDSVTMFIFLLLCSRYFELAARRKASTSLEKMQRALPASAARMAGYPADRAAETVAANALAEGDYILVKPGEAIATDSTVVEGDTTIDVALLTGESRPQHRTAGAMVPGGAVNIAQAIVLRVSKPARDSTLSLLVRLVAQAGQAKPQLAQWADRVAAWFVGALLLLAIAVFLFWHWHDPTRAWPIAIAVLVVSCPCALSLATPTALAAATDRLVSHGVLVVKPHVLETLHRATHVVFDKTGTLTLGRPAVTHIKSLCGEATGRALAIAAALETMNSHPIATAITSAAEASPAGTVAATDIGHFPGQGIEGRVAGQTYRLGSRHFVLQLSGLPRSHDAIDAGLTSVYLGNRDGWIARFDLSDAIRRDAHALVASFKSAGKKVILLSGDQESTVRHVARELGIDAAYGERLPGEKLDFVRELQAGGGVVAMVGDGINDAAVLAAADVSFAMGGGAALAQAHADTVLLSNRLSSLREAADVAAKTMLVVRQNLVWASLYNLVAIPAAACGWLNPWLSGIGMAVSSAVVVANALRLRSGPAIDPCPVATASAYLA